METKNPFSCCEPNGLSRFSRIYLNTGPLAGGARKLKIQIGAKRRLRGRASIVNVAPLNRSAACSGMGSGTAGL
jgi:hypothetical protein